MDGCTCAIVRRLPVRGPAGAGKAARPVRVLWVLQHVWAACWIWTKRDTAFRGVLFTFSLPPAVRPVSILAAPHVLPSYVTTHSPAPVSVDLKTLNGARAHADGKAYSLSCLSGRPWCLQQRRKGQVCGASHHPCSTHSCRR